MQRKTAARHAGATLTALLSFGGIPAALADNPAAGVEAPTVEVISNTPLPGIGVTPNEVPANVQSATGAEIRRDDAVSLPQFMNDAITGVTVTGGQGNAFQSEVNYRGLSASPILGTPMGLSVFLDGVRVNESFGDVVNWDLIPLNAVSTMTLIPGSNPVFGLNTLGGSLSLQTKTGFNFPGFTAAVSGGSWGRNAAEFEYGGHKDKWDWFAAGNYLDENGWRDYSPSRIKQFFGKVGRETGETDFDLSLVLADNKLQGTQALPVSMLYEPSQAYTWPDVNQNKLTFVNGRASHFFSDKLLLAGNAYYRRYKNQNFSSNVNDDCEDAAVLPGNCTGGTASGENQGFNDQSSTETTGWGGALQLTWLGDLAGRRNTFTAGASADLGNTDFGQAEQTADFSALRESVGTSGFTVLTGVKTENRYYGVYFTDTLSLTEALTLTLAGRYNIAQVNIQDQTGNDPQLNGNHDYSRFNPAAGLNFELAKGTVIYGAYNEGMRVPTAMELSCADPNQPCRLPNNFLADPPLDPVISKTYEVGARGQVGGRFGWSAAAYRTTLDNDILFISSGGALNAGFFDNVGQTRRQGGELGATARFGELAIAGGYSYTSATFESPLVIHSPNNSSADPTTGDILVTPGNRIPGIPQNAFKLRADYDFGERVRVGASLVYNSGQYARGDENNQDINGKAGGYTVVNLNASWLIAGGWEVFGWVNNLFDKQYSTLGVLGENFFTGPGNSFDAANARAEQFQAPGAPRGIWVGIRWTGESRRKAGTARPDND